MNESATQLPWLEWLLEVLHGAQWYLLRAMHAVGLVGDVDGQPAWPWPWRVTGENLVIDLGQARQVGISLAIVLAALVLVGVALFWRRGRAVLLCVAVVGLVLAPWPQASVLLTPAHPTSFHENPLPFSDASIAGGARNYEKYCLQCHGAKGNGQGPLASTQTVWPPSFIGPLLWRRADGDLYWAVRHGVQAANGQRTMQGFDDRLNDRQTWALLHYLRALGAGEMLKASGAWAQPVHLPDMQLRCQNAELQSPGAWKGQRLLLTTTDPSELLPDPRMATFWLPANGQEPQRIPDQVDCVITSVKDAQLAIALVNGTSQVNDLQLLTDRGGWLRARNTRGAAAWTDDDLVCKAPVRDAIPGAAPIAEDELTRIIRLMDAEPVRFVKGGRVH